MPHLSVNFHPELSGLTLDDLIGKIVEQIPGTKVTAENWYAIRRVEEDRVLQKLNNSGYPVRFGDEILSSVDRADAACGPTKGISISMAGKGILNGRISRDLILVYSDTPIDQELADHLVAILNSLGIVKDVRISNLQPPWKAKNNE